MATNIGDDADLLVGSILHQLHRDAVHSCGRRFRLMKKGLEVSAAHFLSLQKPFSRQSAQ